MEDLQDEINLAFSTTLKKKKKKRVTVVEEGAYEEPPAPMEQEPLEEAVVPQPAEEDVNMFADMKKKKKKSKKEIPLDFEEAQVEEPAAAVEGGEEEVLESSYPPMEDPAAAADPTATFGKKKKKKKAFEDFEAQIRADEQDGDTGSLTDLVTGVAGGAGGESEGAGAEEAWLSSNRDYTFNELLTRVFQILRQKNPEIRGERRTYTIVPPQVTREGSKKTAFSNVIDIAKRMRRQPDHVIQFLFSELGTSGSLDGSQRLLIKGIFKPKQIETVLKKYIVEYVSCKTCKSAETILTKENRLFFVQCESCGSTRSVSAIKTGFVAQGKRLKPTE